MSKVLPQMFIPTVALLLNATSYVNNSLININDIGKEEDRSNANRSLVCQTTNQQCCFNSSKGGWYTPNGREVTDVFTMETGLYMSRGEDGTVRLNQPAVGGVAIPSGVFHCEIPDFDNTTQYLFIGIYSNNTGKLYTEICTSYFCQCIVKLSFISTHPCSGIAMTNDTHTHTLPLLQDMWLSMI